MRIDIKAIINDPVSRRELIVRVIMAMQAHEGREPNRERAEEALNQILTKGGEIHGKAIQEGEAHRGRVREAKKDGETDEISRCEGEVLQPSEADSDSGPVRLSKEIGTTQDPGLQNQRHEGHRRHQGCNGDGSR